MDTTESSATHAHPSTEELDDSIEAHYACLERPCACLEGWVFVGYIDELGEESEASYRCRRCVDGRKPRPDKPGSYQDAQGQGYWTYQGPARTGSPDWDYGPCA